MIVNVICDECQEAVAKHVVFETKWKQVALCKTCHDDVDHEAIYKCCFLYANLPDGLKNLVANNPDATTATIVDYVIDTVVVPVFLTPFDTAIRAALRDRSCFRPVKVEGSKAFRYEVVDE